jgi:hypothetical protein
MVDKYPTFPRKAIGPQPAAADAYRDSHTVDEAPVRIERATRGR